MYGLLVTFKYLNIISRRENFSGRDPMCKICKIMHTFLNHSRGITIKVTIKKEVSATV